MEMPGVGPLIKDEQIGWYVSEPVAAGALRGAVGRIVVDDEALIADPAAHCTPNGHLWNVVVTGVDARHMVAARAAHRLQSSFGRLYDTRSI